MKGLTDIFKIEGCIFEDIWRILNALLGNILFQFASLSTYEIINTVYMVHSDVTFRSVVTLKPTYVKEIFCDVLSTFNNMVCEER